MKTRITRPVLFILANVLVVLMMAHPGYAATYQVHVLGLSCPFCAYSVHKKLEALPGVHSATVNLKTGVIVIETTPGSRLTTETVRKVVTDAGESFQSMQLVSKTPHSGGL